MLLAALPPSTRRVGFVAIEPSPWPRALPADLRDVEVNAWLVRPEEQGPPCSSGRRLAAPHA